jgi:hypothetical protein
VRSKSKGGLQLAFGLSYIGVSYLLLQEMLAKQAGGRPVLKAQLARRGRKLLVKQVVDFDVEYGAPEA